MKPYEETMQQTDPQHAVSLCDGDYITFANAPHEDEFLEAIDKIAQAITAQCRGAATAAERTAQLAAQIEDLQIGEVLAQMEDHQNAPRLMFLIAEKLATADVDVAWRGMAKLPAQLALAQATTGDRPAQIAYPLHQNEAATAQAWFTCSPLPMQDPALWLWEPAHNTLLKPARDEKLAMRSTQGLLGFKGAQVIEIRVPAPAAAKRSSVPADQLLAYSLALYGGLLAGALQRLMGEAYAYAKVRQSFGKPIAKHQAVALRLADITLNQQAARLHLLAELTTADWQDAGRNSATARHLADLANKAARDAVQIAAAHGYVEGLPFKPLFEKVRGLSTLMGYAMGTADNH